MLASAAPRRSSFARSSSLARPCSSGSTTPSAGISNCRARTRTKRASSVTGVRVKGNARVCASISTAPYRGTVARRVSGQTNPVQICIDIVEAPRSFAHASRAYRHVPVGLEHHSSSVTTLRIRSSVDAASRCAYALCMRCAHLFWFLELEQTILS